MPHPLEAVTLNLIGIIGLSGGLDYITSHSLDTIHEKEMALIKRFDSGVKALENVEMYGADGGKEYTTLLTINVKGMHPIDVGAVLDCDFGIALRTGLHCAPLVDETLGTFPRGAVRFSPGPFNKEDYIDKAVSALSTISQSRRSG
jgi:cysteine desulfurase / selenocysteine lyase